MASLDEHLTLYVKVEITPEDRALLNNILRIIDQTGIAPAISVNSPVYRVIQTKEDKQQ